MQLTVTLLATATHAAMPVQESNYLFKKCSLFLSLKQSNNSSNLPSSPYSIECAEEQKGTAHPAKISNNWKTNLSLQLAT